MVQAGMITGFDSDTLETFGHQFEFLQAAGIPMVLLAMLNALDGTPLQRRLANENRLKPLLLADAALDTNVVPAQMTSRELLKGTVWLLNKLYAPHNFLERLRVFAEQLPTSREHIAYRRSDAFWERVANSYAALAPSFATCPSKPRDSSAAATRTGWVPRWCSIAAQSACCAAGACGIRNRRSWTSQRSGRWHESRQTRSKAGCCGDSRLDWANEPKKSIATCPSAITGWTRSTRSNWRPSWRNGRVRRARHPDIRLPDRQRRRAVPRRDTRLRPDWAGADVQALLSELEAPPER